MKKLIFCLLFGFSIAIHSQESGIKFNEGTLLSEALIKSKKEGKLIFIDCFTTWCGPCKYLSSQVFPLKEVGDFYNKNFINLSFDMEKEEIKKAMGIYHVEAYPTLLFLNSKGEVVHKSVGSRGADALIELGKTALDNTKNFMAISKKIDKGDRSAETIIAYLSIDGEAKNKDAILNDYYKSLSNDDKFAQQYWDLFVGFIYDIENPQFSFFISNRNKYESLYGKETVESKMMQGFDSYSRKYRNDEAKLAKLKEIDSTLYLKKKKRDDFYMAGEKIEQENVKQEDWNDFIQKGDIYFTQLDVDPMECNNVCWYVYEHYKTFNDTQALKIAKEWSAKSYTAQPTNHYINDTYAHILFDLGYIEEAIKHEEIAIKLASSESPENAEFYTKELEKFKKELK
jgi:thiol-disulfide isomerase/thioredoxin